MNDNPVCSVSNRLANSKQWIRLHGEVIRDIKSCNKWQMAIFLIGFGNEI